MREKGTNRSAFLRGEVDKYTWVSEGSSFVLSDVLAAVLDAQLDKLEEIQARRAAVAALYRSQPRRMGAVQRVTLPGRWRGPAARTTTASTSSSPMSAPATWPRPGSTRGASRPASTMCPSIPHPRGARWARATSRSPSRTAIAGTLLRLPLHPALTSEDVERVVDAVRESVP